MSDWPQNADVVLPIPDLPECSACRRTSLGLAPGETCGRDDCPGEATRERVTDFGPVPPPRPREWAKVTGLRVSARRVEHIETGETGAVVREEPLPEALVDRQVTPGLRHVVLETWSSRLWRRVRERWVSMWARIAQFMGVDFDG